MVAFSDTYYASMADAIARGPQLYGGDRTIAALRCFKRYHKDATTDITDGFGRDRWMTRKQARIHAVLLRSAVSGSPITMQAVARETRVCPSTVSRAVTKFQAWGMFAIDVTRGRNGGMRVAVGVVLSYVDRAKAKIAAACKAVNVAFTRTLTTLTGTEPSPVPSTDRNATFSRRVLAERVRLAAEDPAGEGEAIHPLPSDAVPMTPAEHEAMLRDDKRRRQEQLRRQAAFDGDWTLWERIGREIEGEFTRSTWNRWNDA